MKRMLVHYRITTPMFLGGADQQAHELRPPAIKGALRFWWRALSWSRFLDQAGNDAARALRDLHAAEGRLFGTASGDSGASQAGFLLRAELEEGKADVQPPKAGPGHAYLLGQGLYHFRDGYQRTCLAARGRIRLQLVFRPGTSEDATREVERAALLLGLLGGLGSRARKGFGSLAIESLEGGGLAVPQNAKQLRETLASLLSPLTVDLPPFTAFSRHSRLELSLKGNDPWMLLDEIGQEQQLYRSWGRQGKVGGRAAEQNFPDDHDLALQAANGRCPPQLPRRIVFGLPQPYFFSSSKAKLDIAPDGEGRGRRASPLIVHIHHFSDGRCAAIQTLLPAAFLLPGDRVRLKATKIKGDCLLPANPDWQVIHNYLDRFKNREALLP